jgi:HEPN domain-containing protein
MSRPEPGSPADWLRYARSDLILAETAPPSGVLLEALCFHAQQAAEKAIKGVLIHFGTEPPYVHDIERLIRLLTPHVIVPHEVCVTDALTPYAALSRHPGDAVVI